MKEKEHEVKGLRPSRAAVQPWIWTYAILFALAVILVLLVILEGFMTHAEDKWISAIVGIVGLIFVGGFIYFLISGALSPVYHLEEQNLAIERGVFRKKTSRIPYSSIVDVKTRQTWLGRRHGVGNIVINGVLTLFRLSEYEAVAQEIRECAKRAGAEPLSKKRRIAIAVWEWAWAIPSFVFLFLSVVSEFTEIRGHEQTSSCYNGCIGIQMHRKIESTGIFFHGRRFVARIKSRRMSISWKEVFVIGYDGIGELLPGSYHVPTENLGYFFVGWVYGVTTDGAKTWHIWDAEKDMPGFRRTSDNYITDVELDEDGTGTMKLGTLLLRTEDFGKTYHIPEEEPAVEPEPPEEFAPMPDVEKENAEVIKCPNCGALLKKADSKCPWCGHENP